MAVDDQAVIFWRCVDDINRLTGEEIVRLYRPSTQLPSHNLPPRYNICPTDPVDAVIGTRRQSRLRPHAVETRAVVVAETPSRN
jgi:putative SOS response-associated peptidase YedK